MIRRRELKFGACHLDGSCHRSDLQPTGCVCRLLGSLETGSYLRVGLANLDGGNSIDRNEITGIDHVPRVR